MENTIILTVAISVLFIIGKIIEMKYIENEMLPMKLLVRETMMVAGCAFGVLYLFFEYKGKMSEWFGMSVLGSAMDMLKPPEIFTDNPGF
jgi:predicted small integral membrane protein